MLNRRQTYQTSKTFLVACVGVAGTAALFDMAPRPALASMNVAAATDTLPDTMSITAIIRDFKGKAENRGHPDFESYANSYITTGLVENRLDADGKPVFKTKRGQQITTEFKDKNNRIINPAMYDKSKGDKAGVLSTVTTDQLTSSAAFAQWYRDTANVNVSSPLPMTFKRVAGTSRYVFDSAVDQPYAAAGGFFPINGQLYGNFSNTGKNFHFTTEISTKFVFKRSDNLVFTFTGDDDVWVFIDGNLVMDLGGLHSKKEQTLELNRLTLNDNTTYTLKVFHAERHTTQSNFRIETNIALLPADLPVTTGLYD